MSRHTQTSAMGAIPAPILLKETGEVALFSSESLFPPGGIGRRSYAGEKLVNELQDVTQVVL